jgi:hypothetical protein
MKDRGSASVMENGDFLTVVAWRRPLFAAVKKAIGSCPGAYYCIRNGPMRNGEGKNGGGAGTRTPDTGIMIPLLYQLSYTATGEFYRWLKYSITAFLSRKTIAILP